MTWFEELTGIREKNPEQVRNELKVDGTFLVCPDGKRIEFGRLETLTLAELRTRASSASQVAGKLILREVVGDVQKLHANKSNEGALFQVASQFNLLEMAGPSVTPEMGVGIYEHDQTQGPACAISCGAGTIYRNYLVPVGDQVGQSANNQLDCSLNLGTLFGNQDGSLWKTRNGYLFPTNHGLEEITHKLSSANDIERDRYLASLKIGLQWNTAVTLKGATHCVSQAYCSALPVAYGEQSADKWTEFARLVLDAAYESTLCAAIINRAENGSNKLYLTLLGGGVFGNDDNLIMSAIENALSRNRDLDLDVAIVSYRVSKPAVATLVRKFA